jgi:hypothetical protein
VPVLGLHPYGRGLYGRLPLSTCSSRDRTGSSRDRTGTTRERDTTFVRDCVMVRRPDKVDNSTTFQSGEMDSKTHADAYIFQPFRRIFRGVHTPEKSRVA